MTVRIVWDESKRKANLFKHGLDFASLDEDFFADAMVQPARLARFKALGIMADGLAVAVIFKPLGNEALAIISMRPANEKERTLT